MSAPEITGHRLDFTGRRVLVTAGAAGIGLAIATAMKANGADVFVTDVNRQAVTAATDLGLVAAVSDVSREDDVVELMKSIRDEFGGLDVLINNAGVAGPTGRVEELGIEAWKATFDVNVHGQFLCVKHALPLLKSSTDPSIVNMSSAAGRLGMAGRSPYSASKWAVIGFTKSLAIELGESGIRVNAICPGAVDGPRIQHVIEAKAAMLNRPVDEVAALYRGQSSLGRLVDASDIADMALFLSSPLARNVNGQAMAVDGNTEKLF
ncbi:SDR family oxidoreductase [Mycolicibacterium cosmeticum]|uniref:SDR family oxidoreductase n=1 Tax=Mycolicibacterium cosmeticum TaxID=258533 RepID=UPI003204AFA3